jgi:hypothetical protein
VKSCRWWCSSCRSRQPVRVERAFPDVHAADPRRTQYGAVPRRVELPALPALPPKGLDISSCFVEVQLAPSTKRRPYFRTVVLRLNALSDHGLASILVTWTSPRRAIGVSSGWRQFAPGRPSLGLSNEAPRRLCQALRVSGAGTVQPVGTWVWLRNEDTRLRDRLVGSMTAGAIGDALVQPDPMR